MTSLLLWMLENCCSRSNYLFQKGFSILFITVCALPILKGQQTYVVGDGNYEGVTVTTSSSKNPTNGYETLFADGSSKQNLVTTSRFLGQATLGADLETIEYVYGQGVESWLENQFDTTRSFYIEDLTRELTILELDSVFTNGGNVSRIEPEQRYWQTAWWQYTMTSPDIVRNRIALALSEIFVVSEVPRLGDYPLALANYYDMLLDHAFGNFRTLLEAVTLHPAMGVYLTHMNNPKSDPFLNRFPDENYAREVMQLFTIGLYELNNDGSRMVDDLGNWIPTYDNDDISEFARVFTGLTWGDAYLFGQEPQTELSFTYAMQMEDRWHEPGEKELLNGFTIPNQYPVDGMSDIQLALDNLFNHPNVGPFIGHKLIQRLVKSNPSPEYIERVANAFNDNGSGERGDMKAVITAILMDPEARGCDATRSSFAGMLREPIVRYAHVCRAFNAYNESGLYRNEMKSFGQKLFQRPLGSPSVFNFFAPDYQPIGSIEEAGLVAPEFQITNSVSIVGYINKLHEWIIEDNKVMEYFNLFGGEQNRDQHLVNLNLTDELAMIEAGEIDQMIERINLILMHGQMTEETRNTIRNAVVNYPDSMVELKVKVAIFLAMISPDYLIIR